MMTVIIAGSAALIGPENVKRFARGGFKVAGIDNNLRQRLSGQAAQAPVPRRKPIDFIPDWENTGE